MQSCDKRASLVKVIRTTVGCLDYGYETIVTYCWYLLGPCLVEETVLGLAMENCDLCILFQFLAYILCTFVH